MSGFHFRNPGFTGNLVPPLFLLYPFTTATFTNGGKTGRTGPSLTQARDGLIGPEVNNWKNNTTFFNTTNGIQLWTVPGTATYSIEAFGAQGGLGGQGARMRGDFSLNEGEVIRILVGQEGASSDAIHGSGGGGTFVTKSPHNTNESILVIAGGGGGRGKSNVSSGSFGQVATNPTSEAGNSGLNGGGGAAAGKSPGGNGNQAGADQNSNTWAGGGGGFFQNSRGGNFNSNQSETGGQSYVSGGLGGKNPFADGSRTEGGFGGGSGGGDRGAGGGGYSGGGGQANNTYNGGGGGSFNSGTNQSNTSGVRTGHGQVIITRL